MEQFNSMTELYQRLIPALKTKVTELKRMNLSISELDIWAYCLNNIWQNKTDLRIYNLVDDILNVDVLSLSEYKRKND